MNVIEEKIIEVINRNLSWNVPELSDKLIDLNFLPRCSCCLFEDLNPFKISSKTKINSN